MELQENLLLKEDLSRLPQLLKATENIVALMHDWSQENTQSVLDFMGKVETQRLQSEPKLEEVEVQEQRQAILESQKESEKAAFIDLKLLSEDPIAQFDNPKNYEAYVTKQYSPLFKTTIQVIWDKIKTTLKKLERKNTSSMSCVKMMAAVGEAFQEHSVQVDRESCVGWNASNRKLFELPTLKASKGGNPKDKDKVKYQHIV
eukprot:Platyproteum_vivax@DN5747_c0_g1_i1.p1